VRSLLFDGQAAGSSRDKTALRNDNFQTDPPLSSAPMTPIWQPPGARESRGFMHFLAARNQFSFWRPPCLRIRIPHCPHCHLL